jgi:IclR family pca regulon transcriptional regulator
MEEKLNKEIMTSLINGLRVIKSFDENNTKLTLSDVAKMNDISRASARRILLTLEAEGYLLQQNNYFSLTPKVVELGYSYFASLHWEDIAYKYMKEIVKNSHHSCSISVLDGNEIICIMRVYAKKILNESIHVGTRLPAPYSATGRIYMTHMEDNDLKTYIESLKLHKYGPKSILDKDELYKNIVSFRDKSYLLVEEELEEGLISVSVPIYNRYGELLGALNVGTYNNENKLKQLYAVVIPELEKASIAITQAIKSLQH